MEIWSFNQEYLKSKLRENRENIEMWFLLCENKQHYKELFTFLYSLNADELLDYQVESLLGDIETYGLHTFIDQYCKYRHLGFFSKLIA